jgi:hypothetical protein
MDKNNEIQPLKKKRGPLKIVKICFKIIDPTPWWARKIATFIIRDRITIEDFHREIEARKPPLSKTKVVGIRYSIVIIVFVMACRYSYILGREVQDIEIREAVVRVEKEKLKYDRTITEFVREQDTLKALISRLELENDKLEHAKDKTQAQLAQAQIELAKEQKNLVISQTILTKFDIGDKVSRIALGFAKVFTGFMVLRYGLPFLCNMISTVVFQPKDLPKQNIDLPKQKVLVKDKIRAKNFDVKQKIKRLGDDLTDLRRHLDESNTKLSQSRRAVAGLRERLSRNHNRQLDALKDENEKLIRDISNLTAKIAEFNSLRHVGTLNDDNQKILGEISDLRAKIAQYDLLKDVEALRSENRLLTRDIKDLTDKIDKYGRLEDVKTLKDENQKLITGLTSEFEGPKSKEISQSLTKKVKLKRDKEFDKKILKRYEREESDRDNSVKKEIPKPQLYRKRTNSQLWGGPGIYPKPGNIRVTDVRQTYTAKEISALGYEIEADTQEVLPKKGLFFWKHPFIKVPENEMQEAEANRKQEIQTHDELKKLNNNTNKYL